MSHDQQERWRRYQEAIERASQQGNLTAEQAQMIQAAFLNMQHPGAGQQVYTVVQDPDGAGNPPVGYPSGGYPGAAKAPPTTRMPGQPAAMPQGYLDPLYRNAMADLQRWAGQYEKYRGQGGFTQLEPIFQAIKQLTGR
jgi:type II secretory pathway pseudopilin PulG